MQQHIVQHLVTDDYPSVYSPTRLLNYNPLSTYELPTA